MKPSLLLKEKTVHGTALIPIAIHHLSYPSGGDNFFYLHWHEEFEFVAVLKGAVIYTVEDREYIVREGEGMYVQSNQLHAARAYNGMTFEACVVLFHSNLFGSNKSGDQYLRYVYPIIKGEIAFDKHLKCEIKWQSSVIELIKEIDSLKDESMLSNELLLRSKIYEIWHLCWKNSAPLASKWRDNKNYKLERMQPILDYIHNNYKEEITLASLANILPMSEGQFCHAFKEVLNISPIAYVIRFRILQSCTLLIETDWKVAEIARCVGFNNISYFNREFIKAIGCSPSKYRREW